MSLSSPFQPAQSSITIEDIERVMHLSPRRIQLATDRWDALSEPRGPGQDWSLSLPFEETLWNGFQAMCPQVSHIGLRLGKNGRPYTYFRGSSSNPSMVEPVREWLAAIGQYVAIRDCLAMSFALDYDREQGDPERDHTAVGTLRLSAKPYGAAVTKQTIEAAEHLANEMHAFCVKVPVYSRAPVIAAVPPSDPSRAFDLPTFLANRLSMALGVTDVSRNVRTRAARPPVKNAALDEKLRALVGTIDVDSDAVRGRTVLLLEDLYQSGTSINYVGMRLLEAGAHCVLGLSCVKTCRNTDNQ